MLDETGIEKMQKKSRVFYLKIKELNYFIHIKKTLTILECGRNII